MHFVWQDHIINQRFVNFFETKRSLQSTKTRVANNSWDSWKMSPWKTENEEIFRNFSFTSSSKSFFYNLLHLWTRSRLGLKSKFSNFFYLDININFTQFGPLSQHCASTRNPYSTKSQNGVSIFSTFFVTNYQAAMSCPNCRQPLPRCSVCMIKMGSLSAHQPRTGFVVSLIIFHLQYSL